MTKEELKKDIDSLGKISLELYKRQQEILPTLFILGRKAEDKAKDIQVIVIPFFSSEQKKIALYKAGELSLPFNPEGVILISEAFYTSYPKDTKMDGIIPPSQDQNKKEALTMIGMTKEKEVALKMYEIQTAFDKIGGLAKIPVEINGTGIEKVDAFLLNEFWKGLNSVSKP